MKLATTTSEEVVEFLSGGELWGNGGTAALLSRMPSPSHWLEVVVVELEVEQHFLPSREALPFLQQVTMYYKQVEDQTPKVETFSKVLNIIRKFTS